MKRLQESKKLKTTHLLNNNSIHINKLSQLYIIKGEKIPNMDSEREDYSDVEI